MDETVINVSFCAAHRKTGIDNLPGQLHAEWLEKCVDHLIDTTGLPVVVSITCWPGLCNVETSESSKERDVMWRIYAKTRFMTMPHDTGHQLGAAWNIRQGIEFANKLGYKYMIQTAEDCVPKPGSIPKIIKLLEEGHDYVGRRGSGDPNTEVNSEFFGCRVDALFGPFDPSLLGWGGKLELYFCDLFRGKRCFFYGPDEYPYDTSHYYDQWQEMLRRAEEKK